jgi:hypothetical protein
VLRGLIVTLALAALLFAYAAGAQLGGDEMFHLVWGSDLFHGRTPDLESSVAPTMHPLELLVAVPAAALGRAGDDALRIVVLLGLVATAVALYRIGTRLFSWAVGLLAAVLFITRPHLLEMAHHGEPDVVAVAAVAWAAVVALEWPARRTLVLVLLAVAGLFRPEAWLLAIAYAAWQMRGAQRREQVKLAALALAGPVLWSLTDLILTGDPLLSFLRTRDRTVLLARETGLPAAVDLLPHHLGFLLGFPILLVGVLGFVAGLWYARRRALPARRRRGRLRRRLPCSRRRGSVAAAALSRRPVSGHLPVRGDRRARVAGASGGQPGPRRLAGDRCHRRDRARRRRAG